MYKVLQANCILYCELPQNMVLKQGFPFQMKQEVNGL